jgi:uncharacterized repeat protein (TIGR03943 family)
MKALAAIWEGVLLTGFGGYLTNLALGQEYWRLMNPKFMWLTLITGLILVVLGLASLSNAWKRSAAWGRVILFTLLGALVLVFEGAPVPGSEAAALVAEPPQVETRLEHGGSEYTKITTAEVYMVLHRKEAAKISGPLVLRGRVRRFPALDKSGQFVISRVNMICCSADAYEVGLVISSPKGAELKDGDWVRVFGKLSTLPQGSKLAVPGRISETYFSVVSDATYLQADAVESIDRPKVPYIFVTSFEEPFSY